MKIDVQGVSKRFGEFAAVDNITLEIPEGSLTALLGPSGSGKSTLLRVIAGLEEPDSGTILINGEDVTYARPQERGIGFVFQHYAAFTHMSVRENIAFGLQIRKRPKDEISAKVDELLEIVGLTKWAGQRPSQLSGGQRQRMALARALAIDPRVLLLDEPFGALDAKVRAELRRWLRRLHEEQGVTTVLVTHDQEEAMEVSDRIAVMNEGQLQQVGPPREVYDRPANQFVMGFLGPVKARRPPGAAARRRDLAGRRRWRDRGDGLARRASRLRGARGARSARRHFGSRSAHARADRRARARARRHRLRPHAGDGRHVGHAARRGRRVRIGAARRRRSASAERPRQRITSAALSG